MPQYQGIWTLAQAAQLQSTQRWATDPLFENTTLLLQADNAANGAQNNTFLDSSTNNFTITRNGNTTQGTFTPFSSQPGAWSVFLDGSGDYFTANATTLGGSSVSTFTIDGWIFPTTFANIIYVIGDMQPTGGINYISVNIETSGAVTLYWFDGAVKSCTSTGTLTLNQWNYFAIRVSSNAITIYVNSATAGQTGTTTLTSRTGTENFAIGAFNSSVTPNAYLSNLRVSTVARTISIPTSAFSNDADTRFLLFQSNRFINNGSTSATLTPFGNTSVQAFSPFAPQYQYTPSVTGGSGYFDGSGDNLAVPTSAANAVGSGSFYFEAWVYLTNPSAHQMIIADPSSTGGLFVGLNVDGGSRFTVGRTAVGVDNFVTVTWVGNQWYHLAVNRNGTSLQFFVNGTQVGSTGTNSVNYPSVGYRVGAEQSAGSAPLTGYISGLRLVKSSVNTTNFTPPTAPPDASTAALCLQFTNAGIYDGTLKNNLETVVNAQVSTSVVKYGTGSIAFVGNDACLLVSPSQNLEFGSGDFTIEFWWYPTSTARQALYHGSFGTDWSIGIDYSSVSTNQKIGIWASSNGSSWNLINADSGGNGIGTITPNQNAWNHIAYVRSGTTWMLFVNGVRDLNLTGISGAIVNRATSQKGVGTWFNTVAMAEASGYMDDFRITKGIARYTANFTPPTVALPRQ